VSVPGQQQNPLMGRRERKKLALERRIRDAALELFRARGYEATTVEEIAERADVAKGTFFNYFRRKDELLRALAEELVGELLDELGPVEGWQGTSRDQLLRLFLMIGDMVARDPELSKVMMIENMRSFWLRTEVDPLEQEFNEIIRFILGRSVERGEIAASTDVTLSAKLIEAAYVTTMIDWLKSIKSADIYRHQLTVKFDIIFRGLGMSEASMKG